MLQPLASKPRALSHARPARLGPSRKASGSGFDVGEGCNHRPARPKGLHPPPGTAVASPLMRIFSPACALGLVLSGAAPAPALLRIDTFAGRGYGDGGPAIAAAVILP